MQGEGPWWFGTWHWVGHDVRIYEDLAIFVPRWLAQLLLSMILSCFLKLQILLNICPWWFGTWHWVGHDVRIYEDLAIFVPRWLAQLLLSMILSCFLKLQILLNICRFFFSRGSIISTQRFQTRHTRRWSVTPWGPCRRYSRIWAWPRFWAQWMPTPGRSA